MPGSYTEVCWTVRGKTARIGLCPDRSVYINDGEHTAGLVSMTTEAMQELRDALDAAIEEDEQKPVRLTIEVPRQFEADRAEYYVKTLGGRIVES